MAPTEIVISEWLQVCLVCPIGPALQWGKNKEAGKTDRAKTYKTQNTHRKPTIAFKDDCHVLNQYVNRKLKDLFLVVACRYYFLTNRLHVASLCPSCHSGVARFSTTLSVK